MITLRAFYDVLANVVPLYVALLLGYVWVKWLKVLKPDQCFAISKFVAHFAVPLLSFTFISGNNPYTMNFRFLGADTLQKTLVLIVLALWCKFSSKGSLDWVITLFSVSTLPSLLIVGVPMLGVMYGSESETYLVQAVLLQYLVWFPFLLFLLEFRVARLTLLESRVCDDGGGDKELQMNVNSSSGFDEEIGVAADGEHVNCDHAPKSSLSNSAGTSPNCVDRSKGVPNSIVMKQGGLMMTKLILKMVWSKLIRNPNNHASIVGLIWSLISFRWHIGMPTIIDNSIKILSDGSLGMAMFSLGLFMGSQPKVIACGKKAAAFAALGKFVIGPAIMAVASLVVGLKGTVFHIAIVQAAMPLGIVTFVFGKEYNVHPDIQSTGIIFGMLIALPITLLYYILLGL